MPRSPTRVADKLGFESTTGHRNHLYLMYVLVLFVLVTVFVTIYGGLYKDLPERNFGDIDVQKQLTLNGPLYIKQTPKDIDNNDYDCSCICV